MTHDPTFKEADIIPFPTHKTRPSLRHSVLHILHQAQEDSKRSLWSPLPEDNNDRVTVDVLTQSLPKHGELWSLRDQDLAKSVSDMAFIGMFAVQTGQWMRADLLETLIHCQSQAEKMLLTMGEKHRKTG